MMRPPPRDRDDPTNPAFRLPPDGEIGDRHDWASIAAETIRMNARMSELEESVASMRRTWGWLSKTILGSLVGIILAAVGVLIQVGAYRERVDRLVEVTQRLDQRIERLIYLQVER